jgi:hypothetical protein
VNTTTNAAGATAAGEDAATLRAPDARGRGSRMIVFEWEIANDGEGHRRLAVLKVTFRKAGINVFNYERHPTEYIAGLYNEDEDTTDSLPVRTSSPLDSLGLCRQSTSRFSQKGLAQFAQTAARELKARYAASDSTVLRYFAADPSPSAAKDTESEEVK